METSDWTSMEAVIQYSSWWDFPRISHTIEQIVNPNRIIIQSAFNELKRQLGDEYGTVLKQWLLEIWCGHSYPRKNFFDKHPIRYYLGIDLMKWIDKEDIFGTSLRKVRWWVDAFSFLEWLPDNSIPYCFMSHIDSYILNGEWKRLSELLENKVMWKIFVVDSAIHWSKVQRLHI